MASERRPAGWCAVCQANVWLTPLGGCAAGHDASSILSSYMATPSAAGSPETLGLSPVTETKPDHFWRTALLITLCVVGALIFVGAGLGLLAYVFVHVVAESGQGGDYLGTWVGKTDDGRVITLTVESAGTAYATDYVIYDPTNPNSERIRTSENDPEELSSVVVSPDPTGVLGTGFDLREEGSSNHLILHLRDGSARTIELTKQ